MLRDAEHYMLASLGARLASGARRDGLGYKDGVPYANTV
jgi:hypothetical protein